ncbi:MAG: YraN family protein [Candidatus Paceibacterota bacterium]
MAKHNEVGRVGENIAKRFLENKGFNIVELNYRKKWGEIDIVAKKNDILHFIEVKTISDPVARSFITGSRDVTHETFKPEDAVTVWKIKKLHRAISSYLSEKNVSHETPWQLDIVAIKLNEKIKEARVKYIENMGL